MDLTSEPAVGESAAVGELRSESRPTEERESAVGAQQQHNSTGAPQDGGKEKPVQEGRSSPPPPDRALVCRWIGRWRAAGQGAGDGEEEDDLVAEQDLLELGAEKEKEKAVSKLASSPVARSQSGTGRAYHTRPTL